MPQEAGHIRVFRQAAVDCPIPPAVDMLGERWTFLILRATFLGLSHFEEYQAALGIARNILSNRLAKLVEGGVLRREPDPHDRRKVTYQFTRKGAELLPIIVAIRQWGMDAGFGGPRHPTLADRKTGRPIARIAVLADDGRELGPYDLMWVDRQGKEIPVPMPPRTRASAA